MKLIVGLGNPGKEYDNTRHNVGFMVLDNFAKECGLSIDKEKFNGKYCEFFVDGEKIVLLKPLSYMNLSGEVVSRFVSYFNIDINDVLVISDDLDLESFKIRLRLFGSSGGHNGLKNIEFLLGSNQFKRFRIGIGNNKNIDTKDYVLGKFSKEDYNRFLEILPTTVSILREYCKIDSNFEVIMNKYN